MPILERTRYVSSSTRLSTIRASASWQTTSKIPSTTSRQPSSMSRSASGKSLRAATNSSRTVRPLPSLCCKTKRSMVVTSSSSSATTTPCTRCAESAALSAWR